MARHVAPGPLPRLRGAVAHVTAGIVVIATSVVLTALAVIVLFLVLFVVAILFDQPLGSPVAGPLGCIIAAATAGLFSLTASIFVLFPSTFAARAICAKSSRLSRLRPWSEIPVASIITVLLGLVIGVLMGFSEIRPKAQVGSTLIGLVLGLVLLLPLGLYWWTLTMSRFGLGEMTKAGRALQRKVTVRE